LILGAVLPATGLLALAGCEEDVTYSYFAVTATIDRASVNQDLIDRAYGCAVTVTTPRGTDAADLDATCQRGRIGTNLGRIEYSSTVTSGSVTIKVQLKGLNDCVLAEGSSQPLTVMPNKLAEGQVTLTAVTLEPRCRPDDGTTPGNTDAATTGTADGGA
jgi:sirohydrochlorin ferrochelatase